MNIGKKTANLKTISINCHSPTYLVIALPMAAMLGVILSLSPNTHPSQPPSCQREPTSFSVAQLKILWVGGFLKILLSPFPIPLSDSLQMLLQKHKSPVLYGGPRTPCFFLVGTGKLLKMFK